MRLLLEIAKAKDRGRDMGVGRDQLESWVGGESREGAKCVRTLCRADEPWIRLVPRQITHDEETNAPLLQDVPAATRQAPQIWDTPRERQSFSARPACGSHGLERVAG